MTDPKAAPKSTSNDGFTVVQEARTKMIFDTDGDVWTGVWEGFEIIVDPNTGEEYLYCNFRQDGTPYTTSAGYQLKQGLEKVTVGHTVRLTRTGSTVIDKNKAPMTDFKIESKP